MKKIDLPDDMIGKALFLSGEPAWFQEQAREVITYFSNKDQAVLGVEIWIPEEGFPHVVGWSDYKVERSNNWKEFVRQNNIHALKVIDDSNMKEAVYNLNWVGEDEI